MTAIEYHLKQLEDLLPGAKVEVERWAPGDGRARYRLAVNGYECGPYILGKGAFEDMLAVMTAALYRGQPRD